MATFPSNLFGLICVEEDIIIILVVKEAEDGSRERRNGENIFLSLCKWYEKGQSTISQAV